MSHRPPGLRELLRMRVEGGVWRAEGAVRHLIRRRAAVRLPPDHLCGEAVVAARAAALCKRLWMPQPAGAPCHPHTDIHSRRMPVTSGCGYGNKQHCRLAMAGTHCGSVCQGCQLLYSDTSSCPHRGHDSRCGRHVLGHTHSSTFTCSSTVAGGVNTMRC